MLRTTSACGSRLLEQAPDLAPRDDVDAGGRLVQHEQRRTRAAARWRWRASASSRRRARRRRGRRRASARCARAAPRCGARASVGREPVQPRREREVLRDRQVAMQAEDLRHVADARLQRRSRRRAGRGRAPAPRRPARRAGPPARAAACSCRRRPVRPGRRSAGRGSRGRRRRARGGGRTTCAARAGERASPSPGIPRAVGGLAGRDSALRFSTRYTLPSVPGWKRSTPSRMRTLAR